MASVGAGARVILSAGVRAGVQAVGRQLDLDPFASDRHPARLRGVVGAPQSAAATVPSDRRQHSRHQDRGLALFLRVLAYEQRAHLDPAVSPRPQVPVSFEEAGATVIVGVDVEDGPETPRDGRAVPEEEHVAHGPIEREPHDEGSPVAGSMDLGHARRLARSRPRVGHHHRRASAPVEEGRALGREQKREREEHDA